MLTDAFSKAADFLLEHNNFLIVTHHLPDGDAVGSVFALIRLLTENGKQASAVIPDGIPDKYLEFATPGIERDPDALQKDQFDAAILLDSPSLDRTCWAKSLKLPIPMLNIDHHPDNTMYADVNLADHTASASAELVFRLGKQLKWTFSTECLTAILLGIATDSGCFRFANTAPRMMRIAADLLENGADLQRIVNAAYYNRPLNELQFEAELVSGHMKTAFDGKFVWISIPDEVLKKHNFDIKNTEVLIDSVRAVSGGIAAALLRNVPDGIKCSLRSKDARVSVGRVARYFGGGGHEMAAGTVIKVKTLAEAEQLLLPQIEKEINNAI